jgi:hypothetical protein
MLNSCSENVPRLGAPTPKSSPGPTSRCAYFAASRAWSMPMYCHGCSQYAFFR